MPTRMMAVDENTDKISFVNSSFWSNKYLIPFASTLYLPYLISKYKCDIILNLSDVPIKNKSSSKQIFLFDWAYAVYPDSPAWSLSSALEYIIRKTKVFMFKRYIHSIKLLLAQTDDIAIRLRSIYNTNKIDIIPNAVSVESYSEGSDKNFDLPQGYKFLCLSKYYSHKNLEVFIPVAKRIKKLRLNYKIIITINCEESKKAKKLLDSIKLHELDEIIFNIGSVRKDEVPSLYKQTDALLLPTLLESFSGTYVEAMFHCKPILTSRLSFAKAVCGDAAHYFDPFDEVEIVDCMREICENASLRYALVKSGEKRLSEMPTWEEVFKKIENHISSVADND